MRRSPTQTADLEADIFKRVCACGKISRVQLARDLGLAASTAGVYVERLLAEGFLLETNENSGGAGRPPMLLRRNPEGGEFIGVDFEARNIMAVAIDFADRPLRNARRQIVEGDSAKQVIAKIEEAIKEVLPPAGGRILAIGVGVPGVVDSSKGVAVHYKHIRNFDNVPLARSLAERFQVPVFLENNARSMALAELWFGQGKGHPNFICVGIRSGIGAGVILNGRPHSGTHHAAGELGWWRCHALSALAAPWFAPVPPDGLVLEEVASVRALQQAIQRAVALGRKTVLANRPLPPSVADIVDACQQRDPLAIRIMGDAADALGLAIGQLSLVLDPSKVVLAGPLTALGELLLQPLRQRVDRILRPAGVVSPEIVNSTMGEYSGALGAAALALHEWKPAHGRIVRRPKAPARARLHRVKK